MLVLLCAVGRLHGAGRPFVVIPLVEEPPALKAEPADPAWSRGATFRLTEALGESEGVPAHLATAVTLLRTDDALYVRLVCANPAAPNLKTRQRDRDDEAYTDESVEMFLDTRDGSDYFQFVVNASGSLYDGRKFDKRWDGDWTAAARVTNRGWEAGLRIPFTAVGGPPAPGAYWLLNVCRNAFDVAGRTAQSAWIAPGYHRPLGLLCFGDLDARPLFQRLHEQLRKLRRIEALAAEESGDGARTAAAVAALEAKCADPSRVPPDRFATLLTEAGELVQTIEPLVQQAVLHAILDAPSQPRQGAAHP